MPLGIDFWERAAAAARAARGAAKPVEKAIMEGAFPVGGGIGGAIGSKLPFLEGVFGKVGVSVARGWPKLGQQIITKGPAVTRAAISAAAGAAAGQLIGGNGAALPAPSQGGPMIQGPQLPGTRGLTGFQVGPMGIPYQTITRRLPGYRIGVDVWGQSYVYKVPRRMNPLNPKALARAHRRCDSFDRFVRRNFAVKHYARPKKKRRSYRRKR